MVMRGVVGRCPVCGFGRLFHGLRMEDRCPRCGHRFERKAEEGFFLGAYMVNLCVGLVLLGGVLLGYGLSLAGLLPGTALEWGIAAGAIALLLPVLLYRTSKTLWAALDLIFHPRDPEEIRAALEFLADRG